jgi:hypothetical protein
LDEISTDSKLIARRRCVRELMWRRALVTSAAVLNATADGRAGVNNTPVIFRAGKERKPARLAAG